MNRTLRAYIDLLRLQFFFAWPLLFCSGYLLATSVYGGFSWATLLYTALIGFFGFEAGFILNDYIDRDFDKADIEKDRLTKYWRIFGQRPVSEGIIPARNALVLFFLFALVTTVLIFLLPYPNSLYVFISMLVCYTLEVFYQVKKRNQRFPVAQLVGRTDFALFPVAGYLCAGVPDSTALLYFAFFYPFAIAHLGANDLIDIKNDLVRGMNTITTLYRERGTAWWIAGFSAGNVIMALLFMTQLGWIARSGIILGLALLTIANAVIIKYPSPEACLKVLPLFHSTMLVYAGSIVLDSVL